MHSRARTQAFFGMVTSWDYPAEFYARLAKHWPSLGFICAVNGEMGDFGGIVMALDGAGWRSGEPGAGLRRGV
jgi:hypothetical protein